MVPMTSTVETQAAFKVWHENFHVIGVLSG